MPDFDIQVELGEEGTATVTVLGFLDAHTFERMDATLEGLFDEGCYRVIVDLGGVDYISSAGAGVFISGVDTAQENEGDLVLIRVTPDVQEVFELLGLTQILTFADDETAALASLEG